MKPITFTNLKVEINYFSLEKHWHSNIKWLSFASHKSWVITRLCLLIFFSGLSYLGNCAPIYVTQMGAGNANGSSWANAFPSTSLQAAINGANPGDEVWVACGNYYPTSTTDRNISFSMRNNITIYGGFQGTETSISQRNLACGSCSILSGDIGVSSNINDNSYSVISNIHLDSSAALDGFYITDGNDDRSPTSFGSGLGGGLYNHGFGPNGYCNPTIRNCIFENNRASWGGGAFNNAYNQGTSFPTYINCIFYTNHAYIEAGGMDTYAVGGSGGPTVINSIFYENTAATNVGAMYVWGGNAGGNCHVVMINTAFINNHALNGYGGAFISDNQNENGSASSGSASVTLQNCLLWGNTATGQGQQFYIRGTGAQVIAHNSLIDTSNQFAPHVLANTSSHVLSITPQLFSINNGIGSDSCWLTNDDGLQLTALSPCLDTGNNSYNTTSVDILMNPRINGSTIDIGPYEYQTVVSTKPIEQKIEEVSIYPNPASSQITILSNPKQLTQLKTYNHLGQDLTLSTKLLSISDKEAVLDLSNLPTGLYIIRTKTTATKVYKR